MTPTVTLTQVRQEQVTSLAAKAEPDPAVPGSESPDAAATKAAADDRKAAEERFAERTAELARLRAEAVVLRQQLTAAEMKEEQHDIELKLYENRKQQRAVNGALAAAEQQLAGATRTLAAAKAVEAADKAALALARTELAAATAQDAAAAKDRAELEATVRTVTSDAAAVDTAAPLAALEKLVGGAAALDVLRSRYARATAETREAAAALSRLGPVVPAGADPAVATAAAAYEDARARIAALVATGRADLTAAVADLVATVAAAAVVPAGPAAAVAKKVTDTAAEAGAGGALAAEKAVHDTAAAVTAAEAALDELIAPKYAADPAYDPDADATLAAAREAVATAKRAAEKALADRTPELAELVTAWDLALPPETIRRTVDTLTAVDTVGRLAATSVDTLTARLDEAETAYATAIRTATATATAQQAAAARRAARTTAAAAAAAGAEERLLATVRGER